MPPEIAIRLRALWDRTGKDWSRAESLAAPGTHRRIEGLTGLFQRYENVRSHLRCSGATVGIEASMVGYNYVAFTIKLLEDPQHELDDSGLSVFASVQDDDGEGPWHPSS